MKELRIGVIGRTAYGTNLCDGQTVKTQVVVEELKIKYPNAKIDIADTYLLIRKKRLRLLLDIIRCLIRDDVLFVLLSSNGRRVIFPIISLLNSVLKKPIIHDCIGGKIGKDAQNNPRLAKEMNGFTVNYVESKSLVKELQEAGVTNAEYLPNFKRLSVLDESQIKVDQQTIRVCTFSRVCKAKGIADAVKAVREINRDRQNNKIYLDIYGPVEKEYEEEFHALLESAHGEAVYKGVANPADSVRILREYYLLLFPTVFEGEGFPGTLIDAFSSGLPVIATDWHLNSEIIEHGRTGFLYSWKEPEKLEQWMRYAMEHPQEVQKMRLNCIEEVKKYDPDVVMEQVAAKIRECVDKEL